ncbi:hypothetical protein EVAR_61598_1 [Eumeta japonica]|uniref:Uncharacterized protein n=1 Tax=Eumeta variegata TaxID=151549 RepID=A0A4C1YJC6_EUMVA|nr:hypothetical protein EVAR_61598_1 [Eumeta japonica]
MSFPRSFPVFPNILAPSRVRVPKSALCNLLRCHGAAFEDATAREFLKQKRETHPTREPERLRRARRDGSPAPYTRLRKVKSFGSITITKPESNKTFLWERVSKLRAVGIERRTCTEWVIGFY